jgi:SAM-dependent methyltransferase
VSVVAEQRGGHREQVRQLFAAKAVTWSAKYAPDGPLAGRLAGLSTELARYVPPGGRVLDVGCGTGELAQAAAGVGMLVTACDIAPQMLQRAAARDPAGLVEWVPLDASWRVLPFGSGAFDAVVASSVLEYVIDPGAVLAECARVLRPGGMVLCTVPDIRHPVRRLERLAQVVSRGAAGEALIRGWPRLAAYLTYLRISRQRHPARRWYAIAARAGLRCADGTAEPVARSALRLLVFSRALEPGAERCG